MPLFLLYCKSLICHICLDEFLVLGVLCRFSDLASGRGYQWGCAGRALLSETLVLGSVDGEPQRRTSLAGAVCSLCVVKLTHCRRERGQLSLLVWSDWHQVFCKAGENTTMLLNKWIFLCSCLKLHVLSETGMYWFAVTTYWPLRPLHLSCTKEHYSFYLFVVVTGCCESHKIYVRSVYKQTGSFTLKVLAAVYFSICLLEKKLLSFL